MVSFRKYMKHQKKVYQYREKKWRIILFIFIADIKMQKKTSQT